jgi:hypothetical protein
MKSKPAESATVTLTANCILNGQFIVAGSPLAAKDLPPCFRPYIAQPEKAPAEPNLALSLNTPYRIDRRGRELQHQAAQLEAVEIERQAVEEAHAGTTRRHRCRCLGRRSG